MRDRKDEAAVEEERRRGGEERRLRLAEAGEGASERRDDEPGEDEALPSGRRRNPINARPTAASVPSELPTIASSRAGKSSRWACASGIELR